MQDGQKEEVPRPATAEEVVVVLEVTDVGAGEKRGQQQDVVIDQRRLAAAFPIGPRVAGRRGEADHRGDGQRSDVVEMLGDVDADAGGDQHDAGPRQDAKLGIDADGVAALARDEPRGGGLVEHTGIAQDDQLRFEGDHCGGL